MRPSIAGIDDSSAIAASYDAKAFGVKTGTKLEDFPRALKMEMESFETSSLPMRIQSASVCEA
jgi:nucleotidyltransferase/DNA polymerase involved in DNA repair